MDTNIVSTPFGVTLAEIVKTRSVAEAWHVFTDAMTKLGYSNMLYRCNKLAPDGSGDTQDEALTLVHGPDVYTEEFISEKLYQNLLLFKWSTQNEGFASWESAIRQAGVHPSPNAADLYSLNAQFGFLSGHFGSLSAVVPGTCAAIGISAGRNWSHAENDAHWAKVGPFVQTLCETMHLRIASLPHTTIFQPLTARQLEVLYWYGEGKMVQDIATIMAIRIGTVEKHLRLAREALLAETSAHAVRKATALNLLTA